MSIVVAFIYDGKAIISYIEKKMTWFAPKSKDTSGLLIGTLYKYYIKWNTILKNMPNCGKYEMYKIDQMTNVSIDGNKVVIEETTIDFMNEKIELNTESTYTTYSDDIPLQYFDLDKFLMDGNYNFMYEIVYDTKPNEKGYSRYHLYDRYDINYDINLQMTSKLIYESW
jgi:hypothetical protein